MKRNASRKRASSRPVSAPAAELSRGRKWLFRLVAVFGVPLVALGVVELILRLIGAGYDPHFFKRESIGGKERFVANEDFGLRFFPRHQARFPPPVILPAVKAPGAFRIFIFGESAALGDPRPNYGAGNYLEVLLAERFPEARFEIINTSVTAINSHAILPIAQECAGHAGDLWIVYMGNNEMVGPFGAATVFGVRAPPLWFVRTQLQLRRLRLAQVLLSAMEQLQAKPSADSRWHGMEMFLQSQVRPEAPERQRVYRNFQRNVEDLVTTGLSSGAKVVLSTVAVNLKDCPPFGRDSSGSIDPAEKLCQAGESNLAEGRLAEAETTLHEAVRLSPDNAGARFQLGRILLLRTNRFAAREQFQLALDNDTLPFRADSRINESIRAAATKQASPSVVLCDAEEALGAVSPQGISGEELFYEHVHFNPDGNYALARAWAEKVESLLPPALKRDARSSWISQVECEQWLGLTDWNRVSILEDVLRRISRPPFVGQLGHSNHVARLQSEIAVRRQQLTDAAAAAAQEIYAKALRRSPGNFRLHENYAEFLEARRDWTPAIAARKKVSELIPGYYFPHYALGVDLKEAGELAEARAVLLRAAELKSDDPDVLLELGIVSARQGEWERARQELESARRCNPDEPRAALFLGEVLWKLERRNEALAPVRDAIRLDPMNWQPRYRLAYDLAQLGDFSAAATEYQAALNLNPTNARAKVEFAAVLLTIGRKPEALRQLEEALQLDPTNRRALELKGKVPNR
ncbi:MAG TPA: tetratricopeptide repeat protein [Verrucomicrobiae bacterium]|nr:tetratricopeptide repeat protein [Verrucomicrobiae bacterium]